MISIETFRKMALSFPETLEQPHLAKTSFRIKKKIFATLSVDEKIAVLKLSVIDQSVFCSIDSTMIAPVTGGWGRQGWTKVELSKIKKAVLQDALSCAYNEVAPK